MKKKKLVKKKVLLVRYFDNSLIIDEFDECYHLNGNNSLIIKGWNYYCKDEDYYLCNDYLFLVNQSRKDECIKQYCDNVVYLKSEAIENLNMRLERLMDNRKAFIEKYVN